MDKICRTEASIWTSVSRPFRNVEKQGRPFPSLVKPQILSFHNCQGVWWNFREVFLQAKKLAATHGQPNKCGISNIHFLCYRTDLKSFVFPYLQDVYRMLEKIKSSFFWLPNDGIHCDSIILSFDFANKINLLWIFYFSLFT